MIYLTKHEKAVLFSLAAVVLCGSLLNFAFKSSPKLLAVLNNEEKFVYKTDVNTATFDELVDVPYIGEKTARKIIEHRKEHGPIRSLVELKLITGLHPTSLEKASKYLKI